MTAPRARGRAVKIVVTGPFAAGKTTLIGTVSEIPVLSTERDITDETRSRKSLTTVAMDFGRITVADDLVLHLFGTPGQERFDFMWEILGEGMLGYVLLADWTRPESLREAARILAAFRAGGPQVPFVVGLNRAPALKLADERAVRAALEIDQGVPVLACDATSRESVKDLLLALLYAVLDTLDAQPVRA